LLLVAEKNVILVVCDKLSKITYFIAITERISVEGLERLFRDKLLPKCVILDNKLQFAAELTKVLNNMLGIETRLLTAFYSHTDGQIEQIKQS